MKAALLAAWMLLPAAAVAGVSVSAGLNHDVVRLGDQLVLSVAISGSASAAPKPPLIPDVEIYESGKSQSVTIVNGSVSTRVVHTYVLEPRKAGRYVVPPIEVPGGAPTRPLAFTVAPVPAAPAQAPPAAEPDAAPSQPPAGPRRADSPDVFVTAALEKNRAYVNEQVTLVVRFFTAIPLMSAPQYDAPKLTGLLSEPLGAEERGTTVIGGRAYNYSELKSALFPVQAGRASIGPAVVTVQVPRAASVNTGDDFFDRFFNMTAPEVRRLQTDPLALQAEPPPPGAPDDFTGVVGALSVESSVDRTTVKAGEALNLTVTVSGVGNIKSLPEPKRPDLPAARFFDSESSVKLERLGDKVGGAKTFKTVVVPRVSGALEIPPMTASYFDPAKRAYVRAQSKPIILTVQPGDPRAALPAAGSGPAPAPNVTEVAADIRYLKAPGGRGLASRLGDALAAFGAPGPWHALPGAFLLFAVLADWRRRAHEANPRARRASGARGAAERRLDKAQAAEGARAAALLGEALSGYFADRFGLPAASLTLKTVLESLRTRDPGLAARVKALWEELDLLRYAPVGAGHGEVKRLAEELRALMRELDKEPRP